MLILLLLLDINLAEEISSTSEPDVVEVCEEEKVYVVDSIEEELIPCTSDFAVDTILAHDEFVYLSECVNGVEYVYYTIPLSHSEQDFVREVSSYYEIPHEIVFQLMYVESRYGKHVISTTHDYGIMQVNRSVVSTMWRRSDLYDQYLQEMDLLNFKQNVVLGVRELAYWRDYCVSKGYRAVEDYLESYNRGFYGYLKNTSKKRYSKIVLDVELVIEDTYK